jgi:hypothetical protein
MLKYIFLLVNSIAILFYNLFSTNEVTVITNIPSAAKPGTEIPIELKITKGNIGGFAKLQMELPPGFSIKPIDSKGADFSFSPPILKFIWTSLPTDNEITVKCMLVIAPSVSGIKQLVGKFSYIESNEKKIAQFGPMDMNVSNDAQPVNTETVSTESNPTVMPTETVTPTNTVVATNPTIIEQPTESFKAPVDPNAPVSATRTITYLGNDEYNVEVLIYKDGIKGFAKFTDKITPGFTATASATSGASFSFLDGQVKFVWVSLTTSEQMNVSYKLKMFSKPNINPILKGEFSYLENDQSQKVKLNDDEIKLQETVVTSPTDTKTEEPIKDNTPIVTTPVETNTATATPTNTVVANVVETPTVTTNTVTETTVENTSANPVITTSSKTGTISYHVQVGAFLNKVNPQAVAKQYSILEKVNTDMHEGFTKCLVGNFPEYKLARDKRENIKLKGVSDAFVAAYNAGKRITVQEALMISNQQWYK